MISRRNLLFEAGKLGALALGAGTVELPFLHRTVEASDRLGEIISSAPRARYWASAAQPGGTCAPCHAVQRGPKASTPAGHDKIVRCQLCAQECSLRAGERGKCRARLNVGGELKSLVYGRPVSMHVDPIEKKPFYHFLPGSEAFSLATAGCPLRCKFCQNWQISQAKPEDFPGESIPPGEIVKAAAERHAPVIAFTYNEPTVFTEYLTDIARMAAPGKIRCVMISCGFMKQAPLSEICGLLQAIKVDLKGFDAAFYRNVCGAELSPVLRSIKQIAKSGVHLEIVNLVVPTLNDSDKLMGGLADWVSGELGPDVPVHFTRFHPDYQLLNLPPTPVSTLERAREIAMSRGIHYAFVGNVPGHPGNHTYCPNCRKIAIQRSSFFVEEMNVRDGKCRFCGTIIAGVWS